MNFTFLFPNSSNFSTIKSLKTNEFYIQFNMINKDENKEIKENVEVLEHFIKAEKQERIKSILLL